MKDNYDGTVTDESTSLMWSRKPTQNRMTWDIAVSYCKKLNLAGYTDWRLPTIQELKSIVDYDKFGPASDSIAFPDMMLSFYWSSTTYAGNINYAWGVDFYYGNDVNYHKGNSNHVRPVRGTFYISTKITSVVSRK